MGPGIRRRCESQRAERTRGAAKKETAECGGCCDAVSDHDGAAG